MYTWRFQYAFWPGTKMLNSREEEDLEVASKDCHVEEDAPVAKSWWTFTEEAPSTRASIARRTVIDIGNVSLQLKKGRRNYAAEMFFFGEAPPTFAGVGEKMRAALASPPGELAQVLFSAVVLTWLCATFVNFFFKPAPRKVPAQPDISSLPPPFNLPQMTSIDRRIDDSRSSTRFRGVLKMMNSVAAEEDD